MGTVKETITTSLVLKDDPLYHIIKRHKLAFTVYKQITFLNHCASTLAFVSFLIAIISVFYQAKGHLQIMGLASIFHITGSIGVETFKVKRNRYLFLAVGLLNVAFNAVVQIFLTLYILVADLKVNRSKHDFKSETFFHVLLLPWVICSILIELLFLFLLIYVTNLPTTAISSPIVQTSKSTSGTKAVASR